MIKSTGSPILTWKLSAVMAAITVTVLAGGLIARPWFQEKPQKSSPARIYPQGNRFLPVPGDVQPRQPSEDANPPPRMPHVDDLFTPPKKGIFQK